MGWRRTDVEALGRLTMLHAAAAALPVMQILFKVRN